MTPHLVLGIDEASRVGQARREAARLAESSAFDEQTAGRLAIVTTELATNLLRHAVRGRLLLGRFTRDGHHGVDIVAIDDGPGMPDIDRCLRDGYSTAGTPGTGLGAVRRAADRFAIHSETGWGTLIAAEVATPPTPATRAGFEVAALCVAAPGESVSGDAWAVRQDGVCLDLLVADGLGHGPLAAQAADRAVELFSSHRDGDLAGLLDALNKGLQGTRGAAVAAARIDERAVAFCGAGNIAGRLISGLQDRGLLSQHGTAGLQIRRPLPVSLQWPAHGRLVLHSDGLASRWTVPQVPALLGGPPMLLAAWLLRTQLRGRDDATVVVAARRPTVGEPQ